MGITLQDAESYFNENVKNYTAFTLDELKRDSTAFKNMLGRYESRIQLLDEQKKNQYTELLRNSFWKCANISPVREDQLKELINSPYFKIESACSNGKPILIAAIDFCREKMNDLPLRIILQNQKILNTLHLKDAEGNLATDHAVKNSFSMQALQLLLEKRARCQFSYDMLVHIQMVSEGACLHDVINLHENVNLIDESSKKSLAELAHKNNNEEILFALLKCNAKFDISQIDGGLAGLEERANLQAKRKRAEKYYYHHLQPQQKVPQLDASFDLPKLRETIEMFDKDFKYVDEQKQLFYSTQLLSLFQEYANKPGNIEHLKMIIQSPFFKVSDINMKIIVDHAAKVWGVTQEPLQALLCHEDIRSYILKRCETLNPDAGYAVFYNLMMQHGAKFVCSYEQLIQAKACFKLDDFHSILCSLKNINELIPIIIDNKNDELLIDIHMAGVKLKDASVMPNIHVVRPRFEARQKAELFYKNSMLTKDQTEFNNFTTDEFKETEENFKALVDKYNKHMANLDAKHQDHYTRLLENAFKENLKNPTLSLNHLKSITSSPFFKCLESKECKIIIEDSIALCNKKNDVPIQALLHVPSIKKFIIGQYTHFGHPYLQSPFFLVCIQHGVKLQFNYQELVNHYKDLSTDELQNLLKAHININAPIENNLTFVQLAIQNKNYPLLLALHHAGANMDSAIEMGGIEEIQEKIAEQKAQDAIEKNKKCAEKFFAEKIKEKNTFTSEQFLLNAAEFKKIVSEYDNHVDHLDDKTQSAYILFITKSLHECLEYGHLDHALTLIQSKYFNILRPTIRKNPIIHWLIDKLISHYDYSMNFTALNALLKHKDFAEALKIKDKSGCLPANLFDKSPEHLKFVLEKGANINLPYSYMYDLSLNVKFKDVLKILPKHVNFNDRNEQDPFTLAEHAVMNRDYSMLNALHQCDLDVRPAMALGGLHAVQHMNFYRMISPFNINDQKLANLLRQFQHNTVLFDIYFCDIMQNILHNKFSEKMITEIIRFHDDFKERVFSCIKLLPKETQAYIYEESLKKDTSLFFIWHAKRGMKKTSLDHGMFSKIRDEHLECKKNVKSHSLQESLSTISELKNKLEAECLITTKEVLDEVSITPNEFKKTAIIPAEMAFSEVSPELKLQNVEEWGYAFALAGVKRLQKLKNSIVNDFNYIALYGILQDAIKNYDSHFQQLYIDIQSQKISPKTLNSMAMMFPDLSLRMLNHISILEPKVQYALLVNPASPLMPIWDVNLKSVEKKVQALKKLLTKQKNPVAELNRVDSNLPLEDRKLLQLFKQCLTQYEHEKKTTDPALRARLNARINIASHCITAIAEQKPLASNIIDIWQTDYGSLNVFKKGKFFINRHLDNDLVKGIKKLISHQNQKGLLVQENAQLPPPYAPDYIRTTTREESGPPVFVSAPSVADASPFIAPVEPVEEEPGVMASSSFSIEALPNQTKSFKLPQLFSRKSNKENDKENDKEAKENESTATRISPKKSRQVVMV